MMRSYDAELTQCGNDRMLMIDRGFIPPIPFSVTQIYFFLRIQCTMYVLCMYTYKKNTYKN